MKMIIRNLTQKAVVAAVVLMATGIAKTEAQVVVYDTLFQSSPRNLSIAPPSTYSSIAIGDYITLDPSVGSSNIPITQFSFEASAAGGDTATISFYADNAGTPGASFWTSSDYTLVAGNTTYTVENLVGAVAPTSSFFWAVSFSNPSDQLTLFSSPGIGSDTDDFWSFNGTTWQALSVTSGPDAGPVHFGAQVYAVPEPTTIVFGILGGLALFGVRRFRRS